MHKDHNTSYFKEKVIYKKNKVQPLRACHVSFFSSKNARPRSDERAFGNQTIKKSFSLFQFSIFSTIFKTPKSFKKYVSTSCSCCKM